MTKCPNCKATIKWREQTVCPICDRFICRECCVEHMAECAEPERAMLYAAIAAAEAEA